MRSEVHDSVIISAQPVAMKVALVTETYPPEINGVAMTLGRLVAGLRARGHQVQVVRPRQDEPVGYRDDDGSCQVLMPGLPIPGYADLQFGWPRRRTLITRWRHTQPDVVHIATEGPLGLAALHAARSLGITTTSSFHTNFHQYSSHYGIGVFARAIVRYMAWFHNRTQVTMVPTRVQADELRRMGLCNTDVLSRGVDLDVYHPGRRSEALRREWGVGPDDLVLIYVGRIAVEKNIELVHRAFESVRARRPGTRLVLVGSGPAEARFRDRDGVIMAGTRRGVDLAAHFASGDLFAFASTTETFGNVVTEALASGTPVVAFDYAAAAVLMRQQRNGLLVPFDDHQAFVDTVVRLATDDARRRACAAQATASVAHLSWDAISDRFIELLQHCIEDRRRRVRSRRCA